MKNEKINIVLSFNNKYIEHFLVMLESLISYHKGTIYILIYVRDDFTKNTVMSNVKKYNNVEYDIQIFPLKYKKKIYDSIGENSPHPEECYYRIFLGEIIPKNIYKIVYLDADILFFEDIGKIFKIKGNYCISGVDDHCCKKYAIKYIENDTGITLNKYINAGVLVIDLKKWRERNPEKGILKFLKKNNKKLRLLDQDIINIFFQKEIGILNPKWNQFYPHKSKDDERRGIYHMVGRWKGNSYLQSSLFIKIKYNSCRKKKKNIFMIYIFHFMLASPLATFINAKHKIRYKYSPLNLDDILSLLYVFYPPVGIMFCFGIYREFKKIGYKKIYQLLKEILI